MLNSVEVRHPPSTSYPVFKMCWRISPLRLLTSNHGLVSTCTPPEVGPISRVPDDVLYLLFAFVAKAEPVRGIHDISQKIPGHRNPTHSECLGWLRLSAVCRRWRFVLNTSAPLWADIIFHLPPEMASLALSRSGDVSMDIVIPISASTYTGTRGKVKSSKRWGLPPTHRERLLNLAITHATRMMRIVAADLSSQSYKAIFESGIFNSLHILELGYHHRGFTGIPVPTRESLGRLRICAPNAYRAHLSTALPIAYNNGPGLSFQLPSLRYLFLTASSPGRQYTKVADLQWILPLIRGAAGLEHVTLHLPVDFDIEWDELCRDEPLHLPALRSVDLGGSLNAHMHQLLSRMSTGIPPWMRFSSSERMDRLDALAYLKVYGEFIGHSLCTYPHDSLYISRGWQSMLSTIFSVMAFSSYDVAGTYPSVLELLENVSRRAYHSAGLKVHISWHDMDWETLGGSVHNVAELLDTLIPLLAQNTIRELYLDNILSRGWTGALSRFIYSCIPGVTTLYCVESRRSDIPENVVLPCTAALRILVQTDDIEVQARSRNSELEPSDAVSNRGVQSTSAPRAPHHESQSITIFSRRNYILPMLNTIVVSMCVAGRKDKRPVWRIHNGNDEEAKARVWWDELVKALTRRRDIGLPIRTLRIIGGWTTETLRGRTARMDGEMLLATAELVNELIDERRVNPAL
ncbi:hypothetical protein PENSPDRAFT_45112 [Peniophora sp. CONT]|nr:hypothetical protein PENSPDRAFT_45112 [Peniophora sp. CONT]